MNEQNNRLCNSNDEKRSVPLCELVDGVLASYFNRLEGCSTTNLYQLVLEQIEIPLLKKVMEYVAHNQSKAATVLGISRGTLRKKLQQYGI